VKLGGVRCGLAPAVHTGSLLRTWGNETTNRATDQEARQGNCAPLAKMAGATKCNRWAKTVDRYLLIGVGEGNGSDCRVL